MYSEGTRYDCSFMVFFWVPNETGTMRAGYSVSKKVGNACERNLVKRWFRNASHPLIEEVLMKKASGRSFAGIDYIVKARPGILKHGYWKIYNRFDSFLKTVFNGQEKNID